MISPTAAASAAMSTAAAQPAPNNWVRLSQLTPAGAMALAGSGVVAGAPDAATVAASAAAVQPADEPGANPFPLPVIAVLLAVLGGAVYIAFIEHHHGHIAIPTPPPISPA
ncbi:MAG TPA: hypothetical protein VKC17_03490 [Sphingomicrobium sp.]|nr:hypothetical protein [Sphingomicrobium sp.]